MKNKKLFIIIAAVITVSVAVYFLKDLTIERTVETENGVYTGETTLFDSVPNGNGYMEFNNGTTYNGEWVDGKREGYGEAEFFKGSTYRGSWFDDLYNGEGVFTDKNEKIYQGNFVNGELESGIIDDYISAGIRGDIHFQRQVTDFESEIIGLESVNTYTEIVDTFTQKALAGELEFILICNDYDLKFEDLYKNTSAAHSKFIDDVDTRLFEKYSYLANLGGYSIIHFADDDIILGRVSLREDIGEEKINAIYAEVEMITSELIDDDMSRFTKIKILHDYLVKNVEYTFDNDYVHNAYGALVLGGSVCEGYTEAFSLLLSAVGIDNYLVHGDDLNTIDTVTHIWNMVEFDDGYYHIDVTWDDLDDGNKLYYDYFGVSDEIIKEDHTIYREDLPDSGTVSNKFYSHYSKYGKSTYIYYNNATYYGQINSYGLENGQGSTNWFNGDKYTGTYVNGVRTGHGVYYFNDGDVYDGNFVNGEIKGYGTYTWSGGDSQTKEW